MLPFRSTRNPTARNPTARSPQPAARSQSVLQRDFQLSEEEAYRRMQRESRQRRMAMKDIAEAILLTEDLRRIPS